MYWLNVWNYIFYRQPNCLKVVIQIFNVIVEYVVFTLNDITTLTLERFPKITTETVEISIYRFIGEQKRITPN